MEMGLLFGLGAAVYLLPSFIGSKKHNRTAIFLLNLLLGWSVIGWIVALVWATTKDPAPAATPIILQQPAESEKKMAALPADPQARVNRLRELRDSGAITQNEFLDLISRHAG